MLHPSCLASVSASQAWRPFVLLAVCGLLLLAVAVVFGQTVSHDFVNFDDDDYVYDNPHIRGGLTVAGTVWALTAYRSSNWHPLTWLSHMLDYGLYRLKPGGHHLTNVLLHAAAAVVLFLALQRMTGTPWPSAWVAAVFAIHPLRVESVAWVAERKDVLSGLLFMLTLWFYARYVERPASWARYLSVLAAFAMGLTAKPMLVTLPFVLLLLDYWPLGRAGSGERGAGSRERGARSGEQESEIRRPPPAARQSASKYSAFPLLPAPRSPLSLLVEKIPLFVLAAASCLVTLAAQREAMKPLAQVAFTGRVANAAVAYVAYLGKMLYPAGLAVLYPLPVDPLPAWKVVAAAGVLVAISTAVFAARRKCPCLLFGWLWYLATLAPVIGLVQVGDQAMADRYTYLTQIGLYMAIAWGAAHAAGSWPYRRWLFAGVSVLVVAGLTVCAWQQTRHWRDSTTLWSHTLTCASQNYIAHYNLGLAFAARGQVDEAIAQYRKALEIMPDYVEARTNLGNAFADRGQFDEAIAQFRQALEIRPDCAPAYTGLGNVFADREQIDEAIVQYRKALDIEPGYVNARISLGLILARCGKVDDAIACFRKALDINPFYSLAHYNLGLALVSKGQVNEAIAQYRKALDIEPDNVDAHNNLGLALGGQGQVDEAIAHFRKALEIKPTYAGAHYNLGLALACRGQVAEAITHYRAALDLARQQNNQALAESSQAKIRLYEAGRPESPQAPANPPIQR